jgi:sugar phosphate isomerase/epimerase
LNDNAGDCEVHLVPGEGNINFESLFATFAEMGYSGWFSLGFGTQEDKMRVRDGFELLL